MRHFVLVKLPHEGLWTVSSNVGGQQRESTYLVIRIKARNLTLRFRRVQFLHDGHIGLLQLSEELRTDCEVVAAGQLEDLFCVM